MAFVALAVLLEAGAARAADASPVLIVQAQVSHDSNINLAAPTASQFSDLVEELDITAGRRLQLSPFNRLTITAELKTEFYTDFPKLNNVQLGVNASFFRKYGLGARAPWLRLDAGAARIDANDRYHDGMEYSGGVTLGKNLSDRLGLTASFSQTSRTAKGNDVYSGNGYTAAVTAGYVFDSGLKLSLGYAQRRGDAAYHRYATFKFSQPMLDDEETVYGQYAYRRVSRTRMSSVTLGYPISDNATVFLGYERYDALWIVRSYAGEILRIGIVKSYR